MEWINVKEKLPNCIAGKFKVKTEDEEFECYFYLDGVSWIQFYGQKSCNWWKCETKEPVHNVTHWKSLKDKQ